MFRTPHILIVGGGYAGFYAARNLLAWLIHRGYHGFAIPTWERKVLVMSGGGAQDVR